MTIGANAKVRSSKPNGIAFVDEFARTKAAQNIEIRTQKRISTTGSVA